jgi:MOSC domain-containing protein YiiM
VGSVLGLHRSAQHGFSKGSVEEVELVAGVGVLGDAHAGPLVKHRSRVAADPDQPNLRQVHLLDGEILAGLAEVGHHVAPGDLGENVTTAGIDLHSLPMGSVLRLGAAALVALTGLRNPCGQIEGFQAGLLQHVRQRDHGAGVIRRAGVMGVVLHGGTVRVGDTIDVQLPPAPHRPLEPV